MPYLEDGKWRGGVMVNGVRSPTKMFTTKKAALDYEAAERKRLKNFPLTSDGMALNAFCTRYLNHVEVKLSQKTYSEKRVLAKRICDRFGKHSRVGEITVDMVATFLEERAKEVSANTANRTRKDLLAMWNWGVRRLDLTHNPVAKTDRLPHQPKVPKVPTEEEVRKFLAVADRHDRNFLLVACITGARKSELFRLTWTDDVDWQNLTIRLGNRKSRNGQMKYRYAPIDNALLIKALQDQWETRLPHSDYVFQNRAVWTDKDGNVVREHPNYGQRFTARRKFMSGLCKRAGIEPFGLHSLRRFFASLLAEMGESITTIQHALGHAHPYTTGRYMHSIKRDPVRRAVNKITLGLPEDFLPELLPETAKGRVAQPPNPLI